MFGRWRYGRVGILWLFLTGIFRKKGIKAEVKILSDSVIVNNKTVPFRDVRRQFRGVRISDGGQLHILEISYEKQKNLHQIKIPIPRGRLREAFELQTRLGIEN